jgi:predicted NBD/HSP70 family sugar kinase
VATATSTDLRRSNLTRALRAVHLSGGAIDRAQLAQELVCTRATAKALAADLATMGLARERPAPASGRRGRPTTSIESAETGPVVAALEIGVERLRLATASIGGVLTDVVDAPIVDRSVAAVGRLAKRTLRRRVKVLGRRCVGVGVAVYGMVDDRTGRVLEAPHLGWLDVDLRPLLGLVPDLPVTINNVANLMALADSLRGAGRGHRTVVCVHSGIGVGGAVVHDGEPLRGRNGLAGEYGHLPLGLRGRACRCGARGCWETEVDQLALVRLAGRRVGAEGAEAAARVVFEQAAKGHPPAVRAVHDTARALGRGLASLIAVHDPDLIVVVGHAADLFQHDPDAVASAIRHHVLAAHRSRLPPVRPTVLGPQAALVGAAETIFARLISDPASFAARRPGASR